MMCDAGKRQEEASSLESHSKEDAILLTESLVIGLNLVWVRPKYFRDLY
jgi:hypothetical protein